MTHARSLAAKHEHQVLSRLEFLGDAVLETIVTQRLFAVRPRLAYYEMSIVRSALVSKWTLAFLCLDHSIEQERKGIVTPRRQRQHHLRRPYQVKKSLWHFMRHSSRETMKRQTAILERYNAQRSAIRDGLLHEAAYPWSSMLQLRPDKYLCDIVESVLEPSS